MHRNDNRWIIIRQTDALASGEAGLLHNNGHAHPSDPLERRIFIAGREHRMPRLRYPETGRKSPRVGLGRLDTREARRWPKRLDAGTRQGINHPGLEGNFRPNNRKVDTFPDREVDKPCDIT